MFLFFTNKKWFAWSYIGTIVVLSFLWFQVKIDVAINEWFGEFYDLIQKALGEPGSITSRILVKSCFFGSLAAMGISLGLASSFITAHYLFRWRTSMVECIMRYMTRQRKLKAHLKGFKKTRLFSRILEDLGTTLLKVL